MNQLNCPCGRDKTYENCCGVVHQDISCALTAEDLMRSRYVAFTKGDGDYLIKSHYSTTCPVTEKEEIENWSKSVKWKGLEILNSTKGTEKDQEGTVEFKAYFKERGRKKMIHENSKFIREHGCWMYLGKVDS